MKKAALWVSAAALLVSCQNAPVGEKTDTSAPAAEGAPAAKSTPAAEEPRSRPEIDLPEGTALRVRLDHALDTEQHQAGDTFTATLAEPVMADGKTTVPKGTLFKGHVTGAKAAGRLKGRGYLAMTLDSFELNGATYEVDTSSQSRSTGSHKKRNITLIGGGSGVGAAIGAIAGGGKGAAIGAGAGAAAGTAGAALTGKKDVTVPAETLLRFTLKSPVRIKI